MAPIDSGLYQAKGNDATCKAQGVLIQLGLSSMFYNMFLSIYFWLVICRNWKEHQFRRLQVWIHLVVGCVGAALAFAAIPYIGAQLSVCSLLVPPGTATLWPATLFFTIPVSCVVLVLSFATGTICWKVYRQQKKVQKWMASRNMELSKKVFWQSFWYMVAFYLTIPWLLFNYYVQFRSSTHVLVHGFAIGFLLPSQGLLNSLVYFQRQRGWTRCSCFGKRSEEKKRPHSSATSTSVKDTDTHLGSGGRDSKVPSSTSDVVDADNEAEQFKEEEVIDTEAQDDQEAPDEDVEDGQPSSREEFEDDDSGQRNDSNAPSEAEFSAVAEYWELNEEDDKMDPYDSRENSLGRIWRKVSSIVRT